MVLVQCDGFQLQRREQSRLHTWCCQAEDSVKNPWLKKARKFYNWFQQVGSGSVLAPAVVTETGTIPGSVPQGISGPLIMLTSRAGKPAPFVWPSQPMSSRQNDAKWIQNGFWALKEVYVNSKRKKKTQIECNCMCSFQNSVVHKLPNSLSRLVSVACELPLSTGRTHLRGQPGAGLRIAKWDRVVNWKFRGISNRASHLLGLTDLGSKGRRRNTPPYFIRYFFQRHSAFPLACHSLSKSNLRCVGTSTEEVLVSVDFPFFWLGNTEELR